MEGIGEKFQQARQARNLSIEEAARMTKIRPTKLAEIEAEDFSHFPSLAYAKGFLLIYGKFLNVDVTPYLDAFESSETITVDGYSYLQDNPIPRPRRSEPIRKAPANKASLLPLVIGIVVLLAGFTLLKIILDIKRLPSAQRDAQALAAAPSATAVPAASATTPDGIVAPKALPLDSITPSSTVPVAVAMAPTPIPMDSPSMQPTVAPAAMPAIPEAEPEVRRAEPVHAEDLAKAQAALIATTPSPFSNRFDIRPLRKTYLRVTVDSGAGESIERWVNVSEGPLQFSGKRIAVKVLDPAAVEIRKNGKIVTGGDADVRLE